jgi:hypothetical protein
MLILSFVSSRSRQTHEVHISEVTRVSVFYDLILCLDATPTNATPTLGSERNGT